MAVHVAIGPMQVSMAHAAAVAVVVVVMMPMTMMVVMAMMVMMVTVMMVVAVRRGDSRHSQRKRCGGGCDHRSATSQAQQGVHECTP